MTEALLPVAQAPEDPEPKWLTEQEQNAWLGVATIATQLPGVLDAQLQRDAGIGFYEYSVLSWLSMAQDHTVRMSQLAELTRGSLSRLSNVVKRLEQRELVRRAPDPTNGRYTNAFLTQAGWECVVRAAPGHVNAVRQFIFDPLSAEQVEALRVVGGLIADRIRCGLPTATEQTELAAAPCDG
jgi:DNA-binding MarR family transcriptional regulator